MTTPTTPTPSTTPATPAAPGERRVIVFVFGMGRSGSSALTRVLSLCGGTLPDSLLGANEGNPLGHWEPQAALDLNEAFLRQHGAAWHDPTLRLQGEVPFTDEQRAAWRARIRAFLQPLAAAPLLLIKEPRITALSDFWFEAAQELGLSIRIVVPVRHPEEVAASLAARDRTSPELSGAMWLKYNLLAERQSRAHPRVFVEYASLLRDWRAEVGRISAALSLDLSVRDESAIDAFLRPDLRRQRHGGRITESFGFPWLSRTYAALSAAAQDQPLDTNALDEIFDAYKACERGFRLALQNSAAVPRPAAATAHGARRPGVARLIYAVTGGDLQALRSCLNVSWYLEHNPDVASAGIDPYSHWITHGINEGRLPCADPLALLDRLMQAKMSPPGSPAAGTRAAGAQTATAEKPASASVRANPTSTVAAGRLDARVNLSCVVDDHPRFRMEAWNWLLSLRALQTQCRVFVHHLPGALSEKARSEFAKLGATLVETVSFGDGAAKYCNKIRQLETQAFLDADFLILSDADIAFLQDPALLVRPGQFRAKTVDAPNPPEAIWSTLFERAGLRGKSAVVPLEIDPDARTFSTNFNGGLYVIPASFAATLLPLWDKWARFCLAQGDLLGDYLIHSDQLGMGLALVESGLPIEPLPAGANLPSHLAKERLARIPRQEVSGIHYHRHVEEHGLPRDAGVPWIDTAIRQVRDTLITERRKGFANDIFWDFRYAQVPQLGSGHGSRGQVLAYKQSLLRPYVEIIGADTFLDVGCGDLEVFAPLPLVNYTGIDVSEQALAIARRKRPDWTFEALRVSELQAESFDYTSCIDVLIHQPDDTAAKALVHDLVRVARKGILFSAHTEVINGSGISFNSGHLRDYMASLPEISEVSTIGCYRDTTLYFARKTAVTSPRPSRAAVTPGTERRGSPRLAHELTGTASPS